MLSIIVLFHIQTCNRNKDRLKVCLTGSAELFMRLFCLEHVACPHFLTKVEVFLKDWLNKARVFEHSSLETWLDGLFPLAGVANHVCLVFSRCFFTGTCLIRAPLRIFTLKAVYIHVCRCKTNQKSNTVCVCVFYKVWECVARTQILVCVSAWI